MHMAKYVPDSKTQRWVIISTMRTKRPTNVEGKPSGGFQCPFCPGHEGLTPPEVYRIGEGEKDHTGWLVRVIPNKFPITDIHEVIIHSPDEHKDIEHLELQQVQRILMAYRDRYRAHMNDGQVLIFCNHGYHAGASLAHPHSQLVVVPRQINLDAVSLEPIANIVEETPAFVTYCPEFSQWPYEVWIAPKTVNERFGEIGDDQLTHLAKVFQDALRRIETVLLDPAVPFKQANEPFVYNYYIYHGTNWFIRITPRAVHRAGFELGTGLNVNVVDPTSAAERLRSITI
jgi:UDPglucose--hexose-1-phosphate uridylyltransferase